MIVMVVRFGALNDGHPQKHRLEAKVMFEALLTRFHGLAVDGDPATFPRVHSNLIDGFAHLPITWDRIS